MDKYNKGPAKLTCGLWSALGSGCGAPVTWDRLFKHSRESPGVYSKLQRYVLLARVRRDGVTPRQLLGILTTRAVDACL